MDPSHKQTADRELSGLIVMPQSSERQWLVDTLGRCGFEVRLARTVAEGLRGLIDGDPDVLIADARLPRTEAGSFFYFANQIRPWLTPIAVAHGDEPLWEAGLASDRCGGVFQPWKTAPEDCEACLLRQAEAKQEALRAVDREALSELLDRLGRLLHEAQVAFAQGGLKGFLQELGQGINDLVPMVAVAVYDAVDFPPTLTFTVNEAVAPRFLDKMQIEWGNLCQSLTSLPLNQAHLEVSFAGQPCLPGQTDQPGELFSVPVFKGEQLQGGLVCARPASATYSKNQLALLYHAVKHLSKLIPSLSQMRHLAISDSLTSLYNRSYFLDRLSSAWQEGQLNQTPVSLVMMDVDRFKTINDYYGHAFGDMVLQKFARLIEGSKRQTDVLARYGGDELVVLLPRATRQQALACAERFIKAVRNSVFSNESTTVHLTASVGVAVSTELPVLQETDLIAFADKAMYKAKERGGDCICFGNGLQGRQQAPPLSAPPRDNKETESRCETDAGKGRLLVVDDDPSLCKLFDEILTRKGFEVSSVTSPFQALDLLRASPQSFEVLLTDLSMPDMDGTELVKALKPLSPPVIPVMVTGFSSADNVIAAMRAGAYDFVRKPVDFDQLEFIILRAVEHQRLSVEVQNYRMRLEDKLDAKTASLEKALRSQQKAYLATLEALSAVIALRESNTASHNQRVGRYALYLAQKMGLPEERQNILLRAGLLHDIGKIGVPDSVLLKPGPLGPDEQKIMEYHTTAGYNLLKTIPFLEVEAELVYSHHERYDGSGYPRHLRGEQIPLEARIFAVADAFDALRSDRVYRKATSLDRTVKEIASNAGRQFDPAIVKQFLDCYRDLDSLFKPE